MAEINLTLSVIILNINGLNTPIKRQRLAEWMFLKNMMSTRDTLYIQRHK